MDDYEEKLGRRILPLFTQNINSRDFILLVHKHNPEVLSLNELARLTKEMDFKPDVDVNLNILLTMRCYPGWFQCILDVCGDPLFKRSWLKTKFEEIKRQLDESLNGQAPPAQASEAAPVAEGGRVTTRQGASSMATLETDNVMSFYCNGANHKCSSSTENISCPCNYGECYWASEAAPVAEGGRVTTRQKAASVATWETDSEMSFYSAFENLEDISDQVSLSSEVSVDLDREIINWIASTDNKEKSDNLETTCKCVAIQESEKKKDSQDQNMPDSFQKMVINDSPQENTEAGQSYSKGDFHSEDSGGSDTEGNSESEESLIGAYISKQEFPDFEILEDVTHDPSFLGESHKMRPAFPQNNTRPVHERPISILHTAKQCHYLGKLEAQKGGRRGIKNKETHVESGSKKRRNEVQTGHTTISSFFGFGKKETEGGKQQGRGSYREGYPDKKDDRRLDANLKFYKGRIPSSPDGDFIDNIHKKWWGDYKLLERHNGYIQWLFPIREEGKNSQAQPLQKHEAEAIKADPVAHARVLISYKMMLDFYGMRLVSGRTGKLKRTDNYEERFDNLNRSGHNYLRITRILKSLGEFGYEHLKKGFIQFVLKEALIHKTLKRTLKSCKDDWIGTIKDEKDRDELYQYIEKNTA